jgi:hypothetical protein
MGLTTILPVPGVGSNLALRGFLNVLQVGCAIYKLLSPQPRTRFVPHRRMLFREEKRPLCIIDDDLGSNVTKFCKIGDLEPAFPRQYTSPLPLCASRRFRCHFAYPFFRWLYRVELALSSKRGTEPSQDRLPLFFLTRTRTRLLI